MFIINKKHYWLAWIFLSITLASYYANALVGDDKSVFLPGKTTSGHYQIEILCTQCHSESFSDDQVLQDACVKCHGKELKAVDDSHPKSKFTDPRNADRTAILDARLCITCHREHQPNITGAMGVTLPEDFCNFCHFDIADDRPSHKDMAFNTCANAGCHNFHDNKALYEDYLIKHSNEADTFPVAQVASRNLKIYFEKKTARPRKELTVDHQDAPQTIVIKDRIITQWASTAHASSGINCTDCHTDKAGAAGKWIAKPDHLNCKQCHEPEQNSFLLGKHGMRLNQKLSPMKVSMARQLMKKDIKHKSLGCMSCHDDHSFNTVKAAVDACLSCHDDEHSKAYKQSAHFRLWQQENSGTSNNNTGVSCATCHMPRTKSKDKGELRTVVEHNQNMNLRPNEKMIRSVCMNCHGMAFSIDSLADINLVKNNFNDKSVKHIESIEMAIRREIIKRKEKKQKQESS